MFYDHPKLRDNMIIFVVFKYENQSISAGRIEAGKSAEFFLTGDVPFVFEKMKDDTGKPAIVNIQFSHPCSLVLVIIMIIIYTIC